MNELTTISPSSEAQRFELAQREAKALQTSDLLPAQFKNNLGNVLIALEFAKRLNMPPLAVMQSMYVIHGKPAFDAKFFIAQIVQRYGQINYEIEGTGDDMSCFVWVTCLSTGNKISGPMASIKMAKSEGWFNKAGSKWPSMPDLMLRYRAAAFFARCYLPDLILGLQSVDEIRDITVDSETGEVKTITTRGIRGLKAKLGGIDAN
ncbi:MAG: hypothetical protein PHG00_09410 [Methylococcales bacterium]|nr:hypothetical protein [Methylococcales bacterium]